MQDMPVMTFRCPPLPFLVDAGRRAYEIGEQHPSRVDLGVFELLYIRKGQLRVREEERLWTVEAGQALLLRPAGARWSGGTCLEPVEFDLVQFQNSGAWEETAAGSEPTLLGDHFTHTIRLPRLIDVPAAGEAFEQLTEAAADSGPDGFWLRQQRFAELLRILEAGGREGAQGAAAVSVAEQAAAYMKRHFRESASNAELAEALGFHAVYIARCMVEVFGCTPQQYLLYYRLDRAKLLLLSTDWPIAQVAEACGFRQLPHFTRLFAAHAGMPPLRFRKRFTPEVPY
ncbi:helix-turn-helix transcriptional regulator [Paenibacillus herberti]|uniref:AraC family transcriptional regulator n=1 Tax=Paenibacillus herberti TaxID=1619309 RepID=A0A229NVU8_9BACL|nr:AraC family transcriptional regulator [Paenibacillus herberti]OXM14056.1 AraC family transcriptional regulator [Paenibacillus herberti]